MMKSQSLSSEPLEVDTHPFDDSDGYESNSDSSTQSITSSILDYVYENGRRYHRYQEGKYLLPNDEREQDRLDLYHHLQLLSLRGNLFVAPLASDPQRILDCGTGTGIWALDAGEVFPSAEVIGVDLSPIQPEWVVPNVRFEVDDLELPWTFRPSSFDFIHSRNIAQSIVDWPRYLKQMFTHVRPGGYIEIAEASTNLFCDDDTYTGSALEQYLTLLQESLKLAGMVQPEGTALMELVEQAGFVDVTLHKIKQPAGPWPKDKEMKKIGNVVALACQQGLESYGMAPMTRFLGMSKEDILDRCDKSMKEMTSGKVHAYQIMFHVVGRRPE